MRFPLSVVNFMHSTTSSCSVARRSLHFHAGKTVTAYRLLIQHFLIEDRTVPMMSSVLHSTQILSCGRRQRPTPGNFRPTHHRADARIVPIHSALMVKNLQGFLLSDCN